MNHTFLGVYNYAISISVIITMQTYAINICVKCNLESALEMLGDTF